MSGPVPVSVDAELPPIKLFDSALGPVALASVSWRGEALELGVEVKTLLKTLRVRVTGRSRRDGQTILVDDLQVHGAGPFDGKVREALGGRSVRRAGWSLQTAPDGRSLRVDVPA